MYCIGEMSSRNARLYPDKEGIVFENTRLTFKVLNEQINSLSNSLIHEFGVRSGDRIVLISKNCHQLVVAYFAVQKIGAVFVPLNYRLTFDEFLYMINDCHANTLFLSNHFRDFYEYSTGKCACLKNYILFGDDAPEGLHTYEYLISNYSNKEPGIEVDSSSDSVILYTSGSTGKPKGVVLTHENHLWNSMSMVIDQDIREEDIALNFLPMYASIPEQFLPHFYVGAKNVILEEFEQRKICETIEKEKVTSFDCVPTIAIAILEYSELDKYDFKSLRSVMYGSAPMAIEVINRFMRAFPWLSLIQAYGLTEAGPVVTFLKPKDQIRKIGSVGREVININLRIVDETGRPVPPNETGELICRSRGVMKGYYNLKEETQNTIKDGWLYTGDLAKQDEEGYVYLVGRKKDIIKTGGFGVSPAEVEELIYKHPSVKEVAVFGIPDPKWGEAIHAVVSLKEGMSLDPKEIIEFCRGTMAGFKKPKSVEVMDELPKGTFGKIDKKSLKIRFGNEFANNKSIPIMGFMNGSSQKKQNSSAVSSRKDGRKARD